MKRLGENGGWALPILAIILNAIFLFPVFSDSICISNESVGVCLRNWLPSISSLIGVPFAIFGAVMLFSQNETLKRDLSSKLMDQYSKDIGVINQFINDMQSVIGILVVSDKNEYKYIYKSDIDSLKNLTKSCEDMYSFERESLYEPNLTSVRAKIKEFTK